jgi:hypothetical protein
MAVRAKAGKLFASSFRRYGRWRHRSRNRPPALPSSARPRRHPIAQFFRALNERPDARNRASRIGRRGFPKDANPFETNFRWRGIRCREFTGLPDTAENLRKLRAFERDEGLHCLRQFRPEEMGTAACATRRGTH